MLSALANALKTPDLRRKILFTLGLIVVFPLLGHGTWHAWRAIRP